MVVHLADVDARFRLYAEVERILRDDLAVPGDLVRPWATLDDVGCGRIHWLLVLEALDERHAALDVVALRRDPLALRKSIGRLVRDLMRRGAPLPRSAAVTAVPRCAIVPLRSEHVRPTSTQA